MSSGSLANESTKKEPNAWFHCDCQIQKIDIQVILSVLCNILTLFHNVLVTYQNQLVEVDAYLSIFWKDSEFTLKDFSDKVKNFEPIGMEQVVDALNDLPQRLYAIRGGDANVNKKNDDDSAGRNAINEKADGIENGGDYEAERLNERQKSKNNGSDGAKPKKEVVDGFDDEIDDEERDANGDNGHEIDDEKWTKKKIKNMGFDVFMLTDKIEDKRQEYFYVVLTKHIEAFKSNYIFPVSETRPFSNLENQNVEYLGYKSKALEYNTNEKVLKLSLRFKAKLSENFENTDQEFPFEWQFLNMQFPYQLRRSHYILCTFEFEH